MQSDFHTSAGGCNHKEQMIAGIVKAVQPDRVFCHNGFFLILVSNKSQKPLSDYRLQLDAIYPVSEHYNYTIINSGDLERLLVQGHLMYSAICRSEYLAYENGSSEMPLSLNQRIKKISAKASDDFYTGYGKATNFLEGAAFYLAKGELPLSAFMLHQATEQLLRGATLAITGQETRTHCISELKQSLDKNGFRLPFLSSGTSMPQALLDRLEKAYLCSRYTDKYEISREDAFRLYSLITELLKSSRKLFEDTISAFTELSP
jgi:HEPN domain-containing protein